jgi:hypothetical protein
MVSHSAGFDDAILDEVGDGRGAKEGERGRER